MVVLEHPACTHAYGSCPLLVVLWNPAWPCSLEPIKQYQRELINSVYGPEHCVCICCTHQLISFDRLKGIIVLGQLWVTDEDFSWRAHEKATLIIGWFVKGGARSWRSRLTRVYYSLERRFCSKRQIKFASYSQRGVNIWQLLQRELAALILLRSVLRDYWIFSTSGKYS